MTTPLAETFDIDFSNLKKKKKKKVVEPADIPPTDAPSTEEAEPDYTYTFMLERLYGLMREQHPETTQPQRRQTIPPPALAKVGGKKTMWSNIIPICQILRRQPDHLTAFTLAELGTEGSTDSQGRLTVKGIYRPSQIESLIKQYIAIYVSCGVCRRPHTTLVRDQVMRLYFVDCEACGAKRSVAPIKSGFKAQTRNDRVARREN